MGHDAASIPVAANELLMRRVPDSHLFFDPACPRESPVGVTWLAFRPTDEDRTGISLSRMQSDVHPEFLTIEAFAARACIGKSPEKRYYVAILSAGELMGDPLALDLMPDPIEGDPGHVLLPRLHTALEKPTRSSLSLTLAREFCLRVVGPFNCDGVVAALRVDLRREG